MAKNYSTQITKIAIPEDARAVLVSLNDDGTHDVRPVEHGHSVINLRRDLLLHLNEYPHSDEWLAQLRDYCDARLAAKQNAQKTGRVMVPRWNADWRMIDTDSLKEAQS